MAVAKAEPGKTRVGWIGTGVMGLRFINFYPSGKVQQVGQ